jgi:guanine deaminase
LGSEEDYLREAIRLSREHMNTGAGGPFGAVVVLNGKIIGRGWNQVTSTNDPTAHAEIMAIRQACRERKDFSLKGGVIYTSCEPCPMCLAAIYWSRIDEIVYANTRADAAEIDFDDDFLYQEIAKPIGARKIPMRRLLGSEAHRVFEEWAAKTDKVPY